MLLSNQRQNCLIFTVQYAILMEVNMIETDYSIDCMPADSNDRFCSCFMLVDWMFDFCKCLMAVYVYSDESLMMLNSEPQQGFRLRCSITPACYIIRPAHPPFQRGGHICAYCYTEEPEGVKYKVCRQCKADRTRTKHFYCSEKCMNADSEYHGWFHAIYSNLS